MGGYAMNEGKNSKIFKKKGNSYLLTFQNFSATLEIQK